MINYQFNYCYHDDNENRISKVYISESLDQAKKLFYIDRLVNGCGFNKDKDYTSYDLKDLEILADEYGIIIDEIKKDNKTYFIPRVFIDNGKGDY